MTRLGKLLDDAVLDGAALVGVAAVPVGVAGQRGCASAPLETPLRVVVVQAEPRVPGEEGGDGGVLPGGGDGGQLGTKGFAGTVPARPVRHPSRHRIAESARRSEAGRAGRAVLGPAGNNFKERQTETWFDPSIRLNWSS